MSTKNSSETHTCAPPAGLPPMKIRAVYDRRSDTAIATTSTGAKIHLAMTNELIAAGEIAGAMDIFISALAGCAVHEILEVMVLKDRIPVKNIEVGVSGIRRPTPPTLFDTLHVTFTLTGDIDDGYAGAVISDIMHRRCPVAATFGRASFLTWEHHIISAPAGR